MTKEKFFFLICTSLLFASCSPHQGLQYDPSNPVEKLQFDIAQQFEDSNFVNAHWGVLIKSLKTGETIYARNEKKMFMPASNMKLFTSSSAMVALGPNYRYTTRLVTNGEVENGILNGDLIMVGSGDPTISGRFDSGKVTITFEQWADSLKAIGIQQIKGNIIGDDNCFDDEYYGAGWSADYETDYYAAQISGLSFNDNCVDIRIAPSGTIADICSLTVSPNTRYVNIINLTSTVAESDSVNDIYFERKRGTNNIFVHGKMSIGKKPFIESVTVENPTVYTVMALKEVLESKGISVLGTVVDADDFADTIRYDNSKQLASFTSLPYSEIIKTINKPSQNFYTEQVFRTIGKERFGIGSMDNGRAVAFPILSLWGVDTVRLRYADGSGLSRQDLITPNDIVSILSGMSKENSFLPFYESLPIAGIDGTIKNRMKGTTAQGNVHAKTGSIGYVRSLSGYVTSSDGEQFVFSMIANHYTVPIKWAEKIQDAVCVMLADFRR
ncbi:MAG: D-alanyl-D-alanine carboxypeptidase/D-alanyl-D-alanine-endopeptidase [Bacteroidota bacterium]|nr:D-alanyl-D-alanine carboxypeptidase/D-alanyl-D-alanine-endopeptidase [Bacteroidota bacterium]